MNCAWIGVEFNPTHFLRLRDLDGLEKWFGLNRIGLWVFGRIQANSNLQHLILNLNLKTLSKVHQSWGNPSEL